MLNKLLGFRARGGFTNITLLFGALLIVFSSSLSLLKVENTSAIVEGGEFSFNDAGSIRGTNFLYSSNVPGNPNFNVNFTGTWPNYQTEKINWVACEDGKGAKCNSQGTGGTGPLPTMRVDCSGIIKLTITSNDGKTAALNVEESGLGSTSGDSYDCKQAVIQNSQAIAMKNPIGNDGVNRQGNKDARRQTLAAACQAQAQSQGAPAGTANACTQNLTAAFDTCYANLGGANGTEKDVDLDALSNCMSNTSNPKVAKDFISNALAGAKPVDVQAGSATGDAAAGEDKTTCAIEGIGWILCPVMNFMANIVDAAYSWIADLLTVQPVNTTDTGQALYKSWEVMRNFANVAFVVAFLIIIYSQLTNFGVSNYGVKKLLPRLVVAAILVNVSYWICAICVDVSNILGTSLKGVFDSLAGQITSPNFESSAATGEGWAGIVGLVLAGGAAIVATVFLGVSILLPALIAALLAIVTVFLVLTLRQVLIILLIVISPLAFVAYLLPNTESLFKKWLGLFRTLLLMFPIIAVIFGASGLASKIVQGSSDSFAVQVMAALITVLPLALTPVVMKTAGGLLNRFGGFVNNPNKGPFDRMRKGAAGLRDRSRVSRNLRALDPSKNSAPGRAAFLKFRNSRNAVNRGRSEQLEELQKAEVARRAVGDESFARKVAGNKSDVYQLRQQSYLDSIDPDKLKLDVDKAQVSNMVGRLTLGIKDPAEKISNIESALKEAVKDGDEIKARAAQEILMNSGNKGRDTLRSSLQDIDQEHGRDNNIVRELRRDIASSNLKGSAADVYTWATDSQGRSLNDVSNSSATWSGLSDAQVAGQVGGALGAGIGSGGITSEKARSVLNSQGAENIGEKERKALTDHANGIQQGANPQPSVGSSSPSQGPSRRADAEARAAAAAAGSSGNSGGAFAVNSSGTTTQGQSSRQQEAQARADQAAAGSSGGSSFVVGGGETERQIDIDHSAAQREDDARAAFSDENLAAQQRRGEDAYRDRMNNGR